MALWFTVFGAATTGFAFGMIVGFDQITLERLHASMIVAIWALLFLGIALVLEQQEAIRSCWRRLRKKTQRVRA
jgi:hypothetical protein